MKVRETGLTLDLDTSVQQRLNVVAALKGISVSQYCLPAIDKELARDEARSVPSLPLGHEAMDRFDSLRSKFCGEKVLSGDGAEFIREARKSRTAA